MDFLNKIIRGSLRNRLSVAILAALVLMGGVWSMLRTEVDIFPDLNAPTVVVMTEAPGYAPEEVEKVVTYPVETAVNGAEGVRRVRSSSSVGFSVVWVEFDWDTDVYRARQIVSERLAAIASDLPAGVGAPTMGPQSSILGEVMIIGLYADSAATAVTPLELRNLADRTIRPRLLALGGVSSVSVIGGDAKEYQIRLDPARMKSLGVTLDEVIDAAEDMNANASGGVIYDYGNEYTVKADINTASLQEIAAAPVKVDGTGIVTIGDVADVVVAGARPKLGEASVEGTPAVLITVTKQPAQGTGSLTEKIDAELNTLAAELPAGVHVRSDIFRQNDFIRNSISNLQKSLFEGALFVILVLFVCLMNLRTTIISVVALPVSIIVSVLVLRLLGFTVNTMSLGGIAIAIGSLVDDAIVDVENVYKRLRANRMLPAEERKPTLEVIYHASAEVRTPIFNSSLIIMAGFLPLFFLSGIEGRMLIPLGVAFIVALVASTVVALTLTPVLCSWLLGTKAQNAALSREPWLSRRMREAYLAALSRALRHKKTVVWATAALFVVAVGLFFTLGRGFLPGFNEGSLTINVSTLPGVSLEESDRIGRHAERIILSMPEVTTVARKTGRAELDEHSLGANVSEIEAPYVLTNRTRTELTRALRAELAKLPGVNVEIGQPISHRIDAMLSGTQAQIAVKLFGPDLNTLFRTGQQIQERIREVDGVADVNIEQQVERPELVIRPRRAMLARHGVSMGRFRRFVEVSLSGVKVSEVYGDDGLPYDLVLTVDPDRRSTLDDVEALTIDTPAGPVPITAVAEIVSTSGPNTINREDTKRRVVISANTDGRDLRSVANDIMAAVDSDITLPEGYHVTYGGQFENEASASRTLMLTSLIAILLILMLLYGEFRNWVQSLVILLNMPLAIIGGVLILVITGGELNIPAIIGFISLMGIATRNGMLLMSRYNALAAEGLSPLERVMTGSADRLLPIVMTALTSALALLPLALGGDEPGNEIQSPMAVVILGGLISSTILNSFVLPAIYLLIYQHKENKTEK